MKPLQLWRISVQTSLEAEEAVAGLLTDEFGQAATSFTDSEQQITTVSSFLSTRPDWAGVVRKRLEAGLARIRSCGLDTSPGRLTLKKLRPVDWAEAWKRHFEPIEIGSKLLIMPSWSRRCPRRGQAVVVLDPGLSFGTGQHPTTAFCLEQLVAWRQPVSSQSFLDLGTGSGILAIAAARLGYAPVEALDFDPDAIRIARANSRLNRCSPRIHFQRQDLSRLPRRPVLAFSLVCANLISTLLLREIERIVAQVEAGGRLVLAGILKVEFDQVRSAYESVGLRLVTNRAEKEWRSGCFERL